MTQASPWTTSKQPFPKGTGSCQSDHVFEWVPALATILIINEKPVTGSLNVSEQLRMWPDRIKILTNPPWVLTPILKAETDSGTTWANTMSPRPIVGSEGFFIIALGHGDNCRELPLITGFFGLLGALFKGLWGQAEMEDILETDDNFEVVASTIKPIYDQTCRSCALIKETKDDSSLSRHEELTPLVPGA